MLAKAYNRCLVRVIKQIASKNKDYHFLKPIAYKRSVVLKKIQVYFIIKEDKNLRLV